jgi:uncharacterized protein YjbI with pentapeptide repeats
MEALTAYIRTHASLKRASADDKQLASATNTKKASHPARIITTLPSPDIQAILTVIGRRECRFEKGKNEHLDLNETNLEGANLVGANLNGAYLDTRICLAR